VTQREIIIYWLEKAAQDLASARENLSAGRLQNSVRDAYFACFHSFSAVLIGAGKTFRKHSEVRSILHRDLSCSLLYADSTISGSDLPVVTPAEARVQFQESGSP
jgi:uncharacterized protein (UPF0332 family)